MDLHIAHFVVATRVRDVGGRPQPPEQWDYLVGPATALVNGDLDRPEFLRILATDAAEYPLLEIRKLELAPQTTPG